MRFLFLIMLLVSCGRKTVYTYPPVPANEASPEVRAEITDELVQLEKDFDSIGVKINLQEMPVVVSPLPFGVVGRCQYAEKEKGAYIILSPLLFPREEYLPLDAYLYEKDFVRVLIHEIGHCYFHRQHEEPKFLESSGNSFELHYEGTDVVEDKIPVSVMPAESIYRMPKALKLYYLSELAGKARLTDAVILRQFADFSIVSNSNTIQPAEKEGSVVTELFKSSWAQYTP
ncbi:MAG: hypothetical protein ACJ76H_07210 [Bacteriovoracaceae bacterium]